MQAAAYWTRSYVKKLRKSENSWKVGLRGPEDHFLREVTRHASKTKALLDIGCGTGSTVKLVAPKLKEAWGIDIAPRLIHVARRNAPSTAHFKVADARNIPFPDESFDIVIRQRGPATKNRGYAKEMFRVLKKGGAFVAITIGEHDKENIKRIFRRGQLYQALIHRRPEARRHKSLLRELGFARIQIKEYNVTEYLATMEDLVFRLERFPIISRFHRLRDKWFLHQIEQRLRDAKGIRTNAHRLIIRALK